LADAALSPTEFASAVTAITSAFGDPTRRKIYLFVHQHDATDGPDGDPVEVGVTAADVAERFALHPNVARHHLDKLAGGGYVEVAVSRDSKAGAGRPSKRYRSTGRPIAVEVPVRQDDILTTLLGRALTMIPAEQAEAMAEEVGIEYGRVMAASLLDVNDHQRSFRSSLHAVADALTAHGFAAHAEKRHDQLRIVSEHCPFGGAAIENPVICAVDRGMVKGMLGALYGESSALLESSIPMGDPVCVTGVRELGLTDPVAAVD
jgi:predicted ArsR family transcriptional regulator